MEVKNDKLRGVNFDTSAYRRSCCRQFKF